MLNNLCKYTKVYELAAVEAASFFIGSFRVPQGTNEKDTAENGCQFVMK
jgi:hypothetical protein